ncbi:nitroreductase/quinone reductase family protein [Mycobacterium sp. DL440]|uniref:nitroreductase/quinone reductase family protein n=1 Tax=Mycobacterium sp. DL440 TaxID=2675523 RepID=UPI00141F42D6|nr:nitroreductase/quinone reductase family protein [Mycobacterium sp. DL440]
MTEQSVPSSGAWGLGADAEEISRLSETGLDEMPAINADVVQQYRENHGVINTGLFAGMPGLLLRTKGARSGKPRVNPLYRFDFEGSWYVIGADGGNPKTPAWVYNLRAEPKTSVEVGNGTAAVVTYEVTARELPESERNRVWAELLREIPHIDGFQARTDGRVIPVFELSARK